MVTNASESPLIQQNQDAFKRLVAFVQVAEGLTIGIVEANFARDLDALLVALQEHPECETIQFEVLTFADPNLKSLRNAILDALPTLDPETHKKRVVVVRGLEQSIGMLGDYPPMVQDLNFIRDDLVASLPYPLLLCLPDYAVTRLARYAPDFWAWKSGVFRFKTSQVTQDDAFAQTLNSDRIREGLDLSERQARINLLQRLLMENQPSGHQESIDDLETHLQVLNELGVLYRNQGDIDQAKKAFQQGLALIIDPGQEGLFAARASILHEFGVLNASQGEMEKALSLCQESLDIKQRLGNVQGRTATLHCMAGIYACRGEVAKALSLYQEVLNIDEQSGNLQGKAATLYCLANIYANQGEVDEALSLYRQAIDIEHLLGNMQGKASNLHGMALIYANQGEVDKALSLYQESVDIDEWIGNVSGKAATLTCIANIYADLGKVEKAFALYQKALEIQKQIGDMRGKASNLHGMANLYVNQGEVDEALSLYQEVLNIDEQIGNVQGEAATLHCMASIYANQGEVEKALSLYEESIDIEERIGNVQGKATTLAMMGHLLVACRGDLKIALEYLQESCQIFQRLKSPDADTVKAMLDDAQEILQAQLTKT